MDRFTNRLIGRTPGCFDQRRDVKILLANLEPRSRDAHTRPKADLPRTGGLSAFVFTLMIRSNLGSLTGRLAGLSPFQRGSQITNPLLRIARGCISCLAVPYWL